MSEPGGSELAGELAERHPPWLRRSTGEQVIMLFAILICASMLASAVGLVVVMITAPDRDIAGWIKSLGGVLSILLGVVVGYVSGRSGQRFGGSGR